MEEINNRLDILEDKLDRILNILEGELKENCAKMGSHIDFVETVYDNVKRPLGYICNKMKFLAGNKDYKLEQKKIEDK